MIDIFNELDRLLKNNGKVNLTKFNNSQAEAAQQAISIVKKENNLIVSKEDLILIKSMTAFDEKNKIGKAVKEKNLKDIKLLVNSMI